MRIIIARTSGCILDFEITYATWFKSGGNKRFGWQRPGMKTGISFTEDYINRRFTRIFVIDAASNLCWEAFRKSQIGEDNA